MHHELARPSLTSLLIVVVAALTWHGISMLHEMGAPIGGEGWSTMHEEPAMSTVMTLTCIAVIAAGLGALRRPRRWAYSLIDAAAIRIIPVSRARRGRPVPGRHPPDEGIRLRH